MIGREFEFMSMVGNQGLMGRILSWWSLVQSMVECFFLGWLEKLMIGARDDFFMEKNICVTLYFFIFFSIPYSLNMFSD
jgi:hypothetical protein